MKYLRLFIMLVTSLALFLSCGNDSTAPEEQTDPAEGLILLGESTIQNTRVSLYTDKALQVGYNHFYIKLTDTATDKLVEEAHITISTLMDMGQMQHASPYENPPGDEAEHGLFPCAANFIMAGTWELGIQVQNHLNNDQGEVRFNLDVAAGSLLKSVVGTDSLTYYITLVAPDTPQVGMNDFEITVHYKESMMSFPAVEDLTVEMTPTMPSMGHGSPNNVNPAHQHAGHYRGQVNFTMTGDWRVDLNFSRADSLMHTSFDINVP